MSLNCLTYRKTNPWTLTYRDPWSGKKRVKSFADENTARQFEAVHSELAAREKQLIKRARSQRAAKYSIKVAELVTRYLESLHNPTTCKTSAYHVEPLIAVFGKRQTARLTCADMAAWIDVQRGRGIGPATIGRRVSILRAAINWGVKTYLLDRNPLFGLRLPAAQSQRIAPPTPQEAQLILRHAAPHIQRIVILGMATGARIGPSELFRLRWTDVDLKLGMVRMPTAAKGALSVSRDVPLREDVRRLLVTWSKQDTQQGCPYVIGFHGRQVKSVSKGWHAALRRAGITRRIRPYDLRHAFATYALAGGADLGSVAEIMSHKNKSMVLTIYQHVPESQKRAAVEAVPSLVQQDNGCVGIAVHSSKRGYVVPRRLRE